jgi:hypothetical protein
MPDDDANPGLESTIAYAIVYRFLYLIQDQETYDEDLDNVLRWGATNSVGTMTYDPAYLDDWISAAGGRGVLSFGEAYDAMLRFLEGYASLGCRPYFTDLIERLTRDRSATAPLWIQAQNLVAEDIEAGEPYRGTYRFGVDSEGRRVRVERDPVSGKLRPIPS